MGGRRQWVPVAILASALGCDSKGTCEFKFDQSSPDGSIPAGLEVCQPDWEANMCSAAANTATLGLDTSSYVFSKGASCEQRGYRDCSGGRKLTFYRDCALPKSDSASAAAVASEAPPPSAPEPSVSAERSAASPPTSAPPRAATPKPPAPSPPPATPKAPPRPPKSSDDAL